MSNFHLFQSTDNFSFTEYKKLVEDEFEKGKSTGHAQSAEKLEATKLNIHRMERILKTFSPTEELANQIKNIKEKQTWFIISEGWCGDAAHNVPMISKIAEINSNIDLNIVLRDDNETLINIYQTNGSNSIPKLIAFNSENGEELFTWGPRPSEITLQIEEYKKHNDIKNNKEEFQKNVQLYYAKDKGASIQKDFLFHLKTQLV